MSDKTKKILIVAGLFAAVVAVVVVKHLRYEADVRVVESAVTPADSNTAAMPMMLELGSHSCIPCKAMMPVLAALKEEYGNALKVEFIDVWKDTAAGEKYKVEMIPTQIFFDKEGKELFRHTGFFSKEDILAKWKELGVELEK